MFWDKNFASHALPLLNTGDNELVGKALRLYAGNPSNDNRDLARDTFALSSRPAAHRDRR